MAFAEYQNELYQQGQAGRQPPYPIHFAELEAKAAAAMPAKVLGYVAGGAGDEHTQRANVEAFKRWGVFPAWGLLPPNAICPSSCSASGCRPRSSWRPSVSSVCAPRTATATWQRPGRRPAPGCRSSWGH
ncbi:FMN-dependent dehydrogenase family protein [Mycobacterium kansasii 824]|nr:FMN-dependent dehydrogenase family protein [Mycobacterium kansasii 824]